MQWVTVDHVHLNANMIEGFHWMEGRLCVCFAGTTSHSIRKDPDKKKYLKLCAQLGVRPVEDEQDGEG